jgi:hypothetical protein
MTNGKKIGRPPGPPKRRVTIYLYESTLALCEKRAADKKETLPGYIARNFERLAEGLKP